MGEEETVWWMGRKTKEKSKIRIRQRAGCRDEETNRCTEIRRPRSQERGT